MLEFVKNDSLLKVWSAVFYAFTSFTIMIINKSVLTYYKFPSFQALSIGGTGYWKKNEMNLKCRILFW